MPLKVGLQVIEIWKDSMEKTVCAYEEEQAAPGQIVFYGPSNFTRWSPKYGMIPLREALKGKSGAPCVVNRGFGSSCPEHQLYYYPRMVRALAPKVLVYSPGFGNGQAFGYSLEESWELAQRVLAYAKTDFPEIRIYLCGSGYKRDMTEAYCENSRKWDSWLKAYAEEHADCEFVNVRECKELGCKELFVEDGVHFNQAGYHLYGEFFAKVLEKELEEF